MNTWNGNALTKINTRHFSMMNALKNMFNSSFYSLIHKVSEMSYFNNSRSQLFTKCKMKCMKDQKAMTWFEVHPHLSLKFQVPGRHAYEQQRLCTCEQQRSAPCDRRPTLPPSIFYFSLYKKLCAINYRKLTVRRGQTLSLWNQGFDIKYENKPLTIAQARKNEKPRGKISNPDDVKDQLVQYVEENHLFDIPTYERGPNKGKIRWRPFYNQLTNYVTLL